MAYVVGKLHVETVRISLESGNLAGLMTAAMIGHTDAVNSFLDCGLDANARDTNGRTPLMEAVFGGHTGTVEELLKRGADANAQDHDGWTALMEAATKGRVSVVRALLAHGADTRIKNKNGRTALRTTSKRNIEVTRLLKEAGAG